MSVNESNPCTDFLRKFNYERNRMLLDGWSVSEITEEYRRRLFVLKQQETTYMRYVDSEAIRRTEMLVDICEKLELIDKRMFSNTKSARSVC